MNFSSGIQIPQMAPNLFKNWAFASFSNKLLGVWISDQTLVLYDILHGVDPTRSTHGRRENTAFLYDGKGGRLSR